MLLILTLTALIVRLLYYFLYAKDEVIGKDASTYVRLARHLAAGDFAAGFDAFWTPFYPLLVASVGVFTDSLMLPTVVVSIITGTLAVPAVYFLAEQSYGRREAVIAAALAVFYPHLLTSTFGYGTENVYLALLMFALVAGWNGLTKNSTVNSFIVGLLLGCAYLTRPEAFGYLFFFAPVIFINNFRKQGLFSKNSMKSLAVLMLGFFLLAAPYIIYIRGATGSWSISPKFKAHIGATTFSDTEFDKTFTPVPKSEPPPTDNPAKRFAKAFLFNLEGTHRVFPLLVPPFLIIFIALGLFGAYWNARRFGREAYLLFFYFLTMLGYIVTIVEVRYYYVLLPILFGWTACGITAMEDWLRRSLQNSFFVKFLAGRYVFPLLCLAFVFVYTLPLNSFMRSSDGAWQFSQYEQKNAGLWLKENVKPAPVVMANEFRPAFYAEGKFVPLYTDDLDKILAEASAKQVDFLVIDERNVKPESPLRNLLNEPQITPQLEPVYQADERKGYKIVIYRVNK